MQIILKDSEYTFAAAAKTITLSTPYDALNVGQVISILNLTTGDLIYASDIRGQPARSSCTETGCPISIAAAVITHTYDNPSHADTDKLQIVIDAIPAITDSATGTTVNAYANALEWTCPGIKNKGITLKNTHATNDLKYKVLTYRHPTGQSKEFVAETTLEATKTADITLNDAYALIEVKVKSAVADTHATYQVDRVGNE